MNTGSKINGEPSTTYRPKVFVHHVTFRLDAERAMLASELRSTFPNASWAEVGRWMFDDPEVRAAILKRVRGE